MSTNTHEQSKTCTDIVNWLQRTMASVERATHAAKIAGRTHETPAAWSAARADARAAEDEVVALLSHAAAQVAHAAGAARHPGAAAAVATLQGIGWTYTVGHAKWQRPGPELDASVQAGEELRGQGYTWSVNLGKWLPPAPSADAQRAQVAEATLGGLGYEWAPKRQQWVCTQPQPVSPLRDAAQAVISARYQGLLTAQMDLALNLLVDALGGGARPAFPADPVRAAAVQVVRHAGKVDGAALPELDKALNALDKALVADGSLLSAWDAEECRNAALEVLACLNLIAASPSWVNTKGAEALTRLGRAVQREQ